MQHINPVRLPSKTVADIVRQSRTETTIVQGHSVTIHDIHYDSRRVVKGSLFCVLSGLRSHGKNYIDSALNSGATAILMEKDVYRTLNKTFPETIALLLCSNVKREMSLLSKHFFTPVKNNPSIVGITGTDGKSSTVSFLYQLASKLDIKAGYWSTVDSYDGSVTHENHYRQTTPEAPDLFRFIYATSENDCELTILEASSHGLSYLTGRMIDVEFDYAGLTNIGKEHLDFHGTEKQYAEEKSKLFAQLRRSNPVTKVKPVGLLRYEEAYQKLFASKAKPFSVLSYSIYCKAAEYYLEMKEQTLHYTRATLYCRSPNEAVELTLPCFANYNIENALLAISILHCYVLNTQKQKELADICAAASELQMPEGRLQMLKHSRPFTVIVDYAHTPQSFAKLLPLIKQHTKGKLIVVFGSAGERDKEKRPIQGSIADIYCDVIILTDEDPRNEDPKMILKDIALGCVNHNIDQDLYLISNREAAIAHAISLAKKDDTVLCLGKGHEKTIEYSSGTIAWNETEVIYAYLQK